MLKRCPKCHKYYWDDLKICPTCRCELIYDSEEQNIEECRQQQNAPQNKNSPWGVIGVVTGLAACFLPFAFSPYFAVVAMIAGIVAIKNGQKQAGWWSIILSAAALCYIMYVSIQLQAILTGGEPGALFKKLWQ